MIMDKHCLKAFEELLHLVRVTFLHLQESRCAFESKLLQLFAFTFTDATRHFLGTLERQQKAKATFWDVSLESNTARTEDADEQR